MGPSKLALSLFNSSRSILRRKSFAYPPTLYQRNFEIQTIHCLSRYSEFHFSSYPLLYCVSVGQTQEPVTRDSFRRLLQYYPPYLDLYNNKTPEAWLSYLNCINHTSLASLRHELQHHSTNCPTDLTCNFLFLVSSASIENSFCETSPLLGTD